MAVDFDALDLVRTQNKARSYNKRMDETLLQRTLKLYRPVSVFTDARSLVPFASFSFPLDWPLVQRRTLTELARQPDAA